jgi:ribonuclease R
VTGVIKRHPDGYGFLVSDNTEDPDVYIPRLSMTGVMTNDRVEAQVQKNHHDRSARGAEKGKGEDRLFGEITHVLSRANKRIVGKYLPVDLKYGVILDENKGWGADLRIAAADAGGATEGDMVAVEILQYPSPDHEFTGRVVERIGSLDDPLNDVKRVIYAKGIPQEFSRQAIEDAAKFGGKVTDLEIKGREDLRKLNLITIDGATARDFDDAIFVETTTRGFHLVVAIADVSHYVKPGTTLDEEAYERGTSTYFPNFVVPMLPEELSNELCSLKPHVPRLCFVCDMQIGFQGEVLSNRFYEGVMESKARVTYGEAQEVVDGHGPDKLKSVEQNILRAADLARILMQKRFREGSLDLEIPETQVVVDTSGETVDIIKSERIFAHRLIEELMLITNVCTARFFEEHDLPGIFRIHDEPNEDNIAALQRYLWNFSGEQQVMTGKLQKYLTKALESMQGKPGAQILNILTLRSMNQAKYSDQNIGHFGLGFTHYSHFTSPIRRYPDLIAHRLIKSVLYPRYRGMRMTEDDLSSAATFLSGTEQRSVKAERQLIAIKKARFMKKFVGEEFEGIISSVAKFGIFVLLRQFDVDGLVKIERLGNDRFVFDEENLRLQGSRTGHLYTIGDPVKVLVAAVDTEMGRIDLDLAEVPELQNSEEGKKRGAPQKFSQKRSEKPDKRSEKKLKTVGTDVQKRGKTEDDSRSVRKERVSKRRRKN